MLVSDRVDQDCVVNMFTSLEPQRRSFLEGAWASQQTVPPSKVESIDTSKQMYWTGSECLRASVLHKIRKKDKLSTYEVESQTVVTRMQELIPNISIC